MVTPGAGGDSAISVQGVSKKFRLFNDRRTSLKERFVRQQGSRYDDFWALRDVSLEIPQGMTYGLIGHNGSGKSTLLKLMADIHRPTSGTITHAGRISAMLELGAGFHPELSGRDNIYLNGSILGMSKKQIDSAVDEIVEFSGLEQFIDTPVKVYSSGMYVRLGFSIAVNLDPEILIIDEIVAVGDEEFQRRCFDHLYELRKRGVTIVFVSHSLPLVQTLCDRVAWLDHGKLLSEGPALQVVDEYVATVNKSEQERLEASGERTGGGSGDDEQGRRGTGEAKVTGVQFLDAAGDARPVVTSGEQATVRISYRVDQPVENPVFGLAFYTEGGVHVAGPNTLFGGIRTGVLSRGEGYVDYRFDELPLTPGAYVVSAAITDHSLVHVFDYRDRAFAMLVQPGNAQDRNGIVTLPGRWAAPTSTSAAAPATEPTKASERLATSSGTESV